MKKRILSAITLTCAASVFAQGTVILNNRLGGTSHVWGAAPGLLFLQGNSSNDNRQIRSA